MVKFLSLHITDFGKLHDFDLTFCDGLTEINEPNGFGKTTVAAFIKAMLYGMPVTRKTDISENERLKYEPWQGGKYGGTLSLETDGGRYRIERYFGKKKTDDTFLLIDLSSGTVSTRYGDDIGLRLFGVNAESFIRTAFFPQRRTKWIMTEDINAKLTGDREIGDEPEKYDAAIDLLNRRETFLLKRGNGGRIPELENTVAELSRKAEESAAASENLKIHEKRLFDVEKEKAALLEDISSVREAIRRADAAETAKIKAERRKEYEDKIKAAADKKAVIAGRYPDGLPTKAEVDDAARTVSDVSSAKNELRIISGSANGTVTDRFEAFFGGNVPSKDDIRVCRERILSANAARTEAERFKAEADKIKVGKSGGAFLPAAVISLIAAVSCPLFLSKVSPVAGAVSAAVLFVAAVIFFVLRIKNAAQKKLAKQKDGFEKSAETALIKAEKYEAEAEGFTKKYLPDRPFAEAVDIISEELITYEAFLKNNAENSRRADRAKFELDAREKELREFFCKYPLLQTEKIDESEQAIRRMYEDISAFSLLCEDEKEAKAKLSLLPESDGEYLEQTAEYDRETLLEKEKELNGRTEILSAEETELKANINSLTVTASEQNELSEQLDGAKDELSHFKTMYADVKATEELLKRSREELSGRYMDGVRAAFARYIDEISDVGGEYLLGTDLSVSVETPECTRSVDYLSTGYRDMLDICMRLALADAIYGDSKPPLILDDPFVNLDDLKLETSLKMLKRLSDRCQIVYLTCSSSRTM